MCVFRHLPKGLLSAFRGFNVASYSPKIAINLFPRQKVRNRETFQIEDIALKLKQKMRGEV